jgi:hypothetical protein
MATVDWIYSGLDGGASGRFHPRERRATNQNQQDPAGPEEPTYSLRSVVATMGSRSRDQMETQRLGE